MNSKDGVRDSNIELLRIIAMLMIVIHHFAVHSGFTWLCQWFCALSNFATWYELA